MKHKCALNCHIINVIIIIFVEINTQQYNSKTYFHCLFLIISVCCFFYYFLAKIGIYWMWCGVVVVEWIQLFNRTRSTRSRTTEKAIFATLIWNTCFGCIYCFFCRCAWYDNAFKVMYMAHWRTRGTTNTYTLAIIMRSSSVLYFVHILNRRLSSAITNHTFDLWIYF